MKKKIFILFLTISAFIPLPSIAQDYLITTKGDTIKGPLKFVYIDENLDRVTISSGQKKTYSALQVKNLVYDNQVYQSMKFGNSFKFMRVAKSGYLGLFIFKSSTAAWDGKYLYKMDGTGIEVPNLAFRKLMVKFLFDCPDVSRKIEAGNLGRADLEKIVDQYNLCIQTKTESLAKPKEIALKIAAINNLISKINADSFPAKKDALDVLIDIRDKVSRDETVPNYLIEGLKSYLLDTPVFSGDLDALITLLQKK